MIQITPQMRIFVAVEAVDFRKGIDGLVGLCKGALQMDPFSGGLFVFRNRRGTSIKALVYDGQGYCLCQKRLSQGRWKWWPKQEGGAISLAAHEMQMLFWNGDPKQAAVSLWRKVS